MAARTTRRKPKRPRAPSRSPFERGVALISRRKFHAAREQFVEAVRAGGPQAPWAAQELVQTYLRSGEGANAEAALRELIPAPSPLLCHGLGYLFRRSGRGKEALAALEEGRALKPRLRAIDLELGWMRCQAGRDAEGLRMLRGAERQYAKEGDAWGESIAVSYQATRALVRFELERALELSLRARRLKTECGDLLGLATTHFNEGVIRQHWSEPDAERQCFAAALELQGRIGFREGVMASLNSLALCHQELGDLEGAAKLLRRALRYQPRHGGIGGFGALTHVANTLGDVERQAGRFATAERLFRRALSATTAEVGTNVRVASLASLADLSLARKRPEVALALLAEATTALDATVDPRTRIILWTLRARAHVDTNAPGQAVECAERAIDLSLAVPGPQRRMFLRLGAARLVHGRALRLVGRNEDALKTIRAAGRDHEDLLWDFGRPSERISLAENVRDLADLEVEILASSASSRPEKAWSVSRHVKARELRSLVGRATSQAPGTRREVETIVAELRQLILRPDLDSRTLARIGSLRRRYRSVSRRAERRRLDAPEGHSFNARSLAHVLGPCCALVEYHIGSENSWAFVAHAGTVACRRLPTTSRRLRRQVDQYLRPLIKAGTSTDASAWLASFDVEVGIRLTGDLIEPVLGLLPATVTRLVVVPDGPLHALPFGLLPLADVAPSVGGWLMDRFILSFAPSSLLLRSAPARGGRRLASFAYSPQEAVWVNTSDGQLRLAPLPWAAREAREVVRVAGHGQALIGRQFTRRRLAGIASRLTLIHVAAHAVSDDESPGLSGLVLSGRDGKPDFLDAESIARLGLSEAAVVLSACSSARGQVLHREGMQAIARAFLEAGAVAVLSPMWDVDDRVTHRLMRSFHQELAKGESRAEALATATRELRAWARDSPEEHPFFWGGYYLTELRP